MFNRLFGLFSLLYTAAVKGATVKDCGAGVSLFTVNSVSLAPTSPNPGEQVALHLAYTVPSGVTINGGTTTYNVVYNFIPLSPSSNPLCQDVPCPLGPGAYDNTTMSTWPSGVSGSFTSTMKWKDPADALLLCIQIAGKTSAAAVKNATEVSGLRGRLNG